MEWIPVLDRRHLKEFKEGEEDGKSQHVHHPEELCHGRVHVRVDVEEEHNVDDRDHLWAELDRASCPNEDKDEELQEIGISEVHIIDVASIDVREDHRCPKVVA